MACTEFELSNLFPLLKHHIALIERHEDKFHRDFSLSFLKCSDDKIEDIKNMLLKILRNSDIIFTSGRYIVIFSPGANWNVAYDIVNGVQDFFGIKDKKDAIVSYPDDGENAVQLLEKFSEVIHKNYDITINFI